jgi:3'(2'), 5'-bisphosphate nucleotidase
MDYDLLYETMRRLAIEAGEAIMAVYEAASFAVAQKSDASPVTEADLVADRIISDGLRAVFPEIPVVTEEQAATHGNLDGRDFLIVDPLDGTKEFIQRRGDFTVNIAYVREGVPVRGVVFAPARERLFYTNALGQAVEEDGTHDPSRVGISLPIQVSKPDNARLRVVASKSHRDAATDAYIARYEVAETRSAGSSLKFCLIATGEADLYPRLGRTMEWDTAAGHAVLLGAGGMVLRLSDHQPLLYGKQGYENPSFLACAPGVRASGA